MRDNWRPRTIRRKEEWNHANDSGTYRGRRSHRQYGRKLAPPDTRGCPPPAVPWRAPPWRGVTVSRPPQPTRLPNLASRQAVGSPTVHCPSACAGDPTVPAWVLCAFSAISASLSFT